ncbi:MAG: mercury resistance system periplasmic binding protein MerP [Burkholderiales bacterium]|nr:mercury resistance system periplasmic binding protein MerP [Burkholderiales bacterium]
MKTNSLFAALALFALAAAPQVSFAAPKTVTLAVPSMNCSACPITVSQALKKVPGVNAVKATLEPPEARVMFDDAKTSVEKLMEATSQAGYPSSVKPGR